jgi:hypothetical protein
MDIELVAGARATGEPKKAVIACNAYLLMGPGRSLLKLQAEYTNTHQNTPPTRRLTTLKGWSSQFRWVQRAEEYDAAVEADTLAQIQAHQQALLQRRKDIMGNGAALDYERVAQLKELAAALEAAIWQDGAPGQDNVDPRVKRPGLWTHEVKGIGSGENFMTVTRWVFNTALLAEYRAVLADIAAETGGRRQRTLNVDIDFRKLSPDQLERIAAGEDELEVVLGDLLR